MFRIIAPAPLLWVARHGPVEAVKYLMAGADVVMSIRHAAARPAFFARLLAEMTDWMEKKGYESVDQMRGSMSQQSVTDSSAFVRGNYIKVLESYTKTTLNTRHGERLRPGPK